MAGFRKTMRDGFRQVGRLDNANVYCTLLFESCANIAKDGMWMKLLNVYTLLVTKDRRVVGNCITINGLTRATVGVVAGQYIINRVGSHTTMRIAGVAGAVGIAVNYLAFLEDSVWDIVAINLIWAIFTGLSNSCLETIFARSLLPEHRVEVSTVRQVLNKGTTAIGPLISLSLFCIYGNEWTLPILHFVLIFGTTLTIIVVFICFMFDDRFETRQLVSLCDVKKITVLEGLTKHGCIHFDTLTKRDFESSADGPAVITYPLKPSSKYSRLKILDKCTLEPARYIIGKQYLVRFRNLKSLTRHTIISVSFADKSRRGPVKGTLESVSIFLTKGVERKVDLLTSKICFVQTADAMLYSPPTPSLFSVRKVINYFSACCPCWKARERERIRKLPTFEQTASESLLGEENRRLSNIQSMGSPGNRIPAREEKQNTIPTADPPASNPSVGRKKRHYAPNIWGANVIVVCDVLNALGNGMSLKFMDLFLVEDYAYSPAALMVLQFFTNIAAMYMGAATKQFLHFVRAHNYHGKMGVIVIWITSMTFLLLICVPGMPWWLVGLFIICRNSLNTSTKAYNRAKLANYLPHDKIANYMVWDSLNKANQGGIAIFGAQLVHFGGYRMCFLITFAIMCIRLLVYISFVIRQSYLRMHKHATMKCAHTPHTPRAAGPPKRVNSEPNLQEAWKPKEIDQLVDLPTVSKDTVRVGLLASATVPVLEVPPDDKESEEADQDEYDDEHDEYDDEDELSSTSSVEWDEAMMEEGDARMEPGEVASHLFPTNDIYGRRDVLSIPSDEQNQTLDNIHEEAEASMSSFNFDTEEKESDQNTMNNSSLYRDKFRK